MSSDATKFSFSPGAEDYIRRFMDSAMIMVRREFPTVTSWIAVLDWALGCVMTLRATGEVIRKGPHFDVGALDTRELANEPIVRLHNGLDVASVACQRISPPWITSLSISATAISSSPICPATIRYPGPIFRPKANRTTPRPAISRRRARGAPFRALPYNGAAHALRSACRRHGGAADRR